MSRSNIRRPEHKRNIADLYLLRDRVSCMADRLPRLPLRRVLRILPESILDNRPGIRCTNIPDIHLVKPDQFLSGFPLFQT